MDREDTPAPQGHQYLRTRSGLEGGGEIKQEGFGEKERSGQKCGCRHLSELHGAIRR